MYNAFIYLILKCNFLFKILNILLINIINKKIKTYLLNYKLNITNIFFFIAKIGHKIFII